MTERSINDIDCRACNGEGLVKIFYLRQWMVAECERCGGFGVDPDALPTRCVAGEAEQKES